jgi:isovaleryl-CoA dehydrogenase
MEDLVSFKIRELRETAEEIATSYAAPQREQTDRNCEWPETTMRALADVRLTGLHVPARLGGHEEGLLALAVITETIGKECPSTGLCFGMHCVASAVITAKATPEQEKCYLSPISEGRHLSSLALSESGSGVHFYLPETELIRDGDEFVLVGCKQFVTNGGHADSYVVSTSTEEVGSETGEFSCVIVDSDSKGMSWLEPWRGLGMRGNSSRGLALNRVHVPLNRMLGRPGDQIWYAFEVVAPYFLMAMSGVYLGMAQAALDITLKHMRSRQYSLSGDSLASVSVLQHRVAEMWTSVEKSRCLVYSAGRLGDIGDPQALSALLMAKADVSETVVSVVNDAMTICGGQEYRENSRLAQLLRDARASHVMAPTTDLLKLWAGRTLLGVPML